MKSKKNSKKLSKGNHKKSKISKISNKVSKKISSKKIRGGASKKKMTSFASGYYVSDGDNTVNLENNKSRCMCLNFTGEGKTPIERCKNKVVDGGHFCSLHLDCPSKLNKYMSGSEPSYDEKSWGEKFVEGSHNCYSYFLDSQVPAVKEKCQTLCNKSNNKDCPRNNSECTDLKPQPGDFNLLMATGSTHEDDPVYKCPQMEAKILNDNKSLIPVPFNQKCPKNFYKGAMVVDPGHTFHFYRQDKDGKWSHKPGISPISRKDAGDKPIYVPHFADRNYARDENNDEDAINYTGFCGYYCIPNNYYMNKNLA